jgi:hypothetical protein
MPTVSRLTGPDEHADSRLDQPMSRRIVFACNRGSNISKGKPIFIIIIIIASGGQWLYEFLVQLHLERYVFMAT